MVKPVAINGRQESGCRLLAGTTLLAVVLAACAPQPEPRTVLDFMDDGLARDGVLTRCNQDRDATLNDVECANARRAAAAIALEAERARARQLEQESEATLLALRERDARVAAAEEQRAAAERAAAEAAYEARWPDTPDARPSADAVPAPAASFGAPVGPVLPSMSESTLFEVYADGSDALDRPTLEIEAAPPPNDLVIASPEIAMTDLTAVPRPFRDAAAE